jgi:hypothetical protein
MDEFDWKHLMTETNARMRRRGSGVYRSGHEHGPLLSGRRDMPRRHFVPGLLSQNSLTFASARWLWYWWCSLPADTIHQRCEHLASWISLRTSKLRKKNARHVEEQFVSDDAATPWHSTATIIPHSAACKRFSKKSHPALPSRIR